MTQPTTKTVLGRVFTRHEKLQHVWVCNVAHDNEVRLMPCCNESCKFAARLCQSDPEFEGQEPVVASGWGPTESDAILALQRTLRKMAELEVAT